MNSPYADQAQPAAALPVLDTGVIRRFRAAPPTFDHLLHVLHRTDPAAARWLYSAAEEIAPADVDEKERYATLALGLYYMLSEQTFVDQLNRLYSSPLHIASEMADHTELAPDDPASNLEHTAPLDD